MRVSLLYYLYIIYVHSKVYYVYIHVCLMKDATVKLINTLSSTPQYSLVVDSRRLVR